MQMTRFKLMNASLHKLDEDYHVKVTQNVQKVTTKGADSVRPIHVQYTATFPCIFSSSHIFLSLIRRFKTNNKSPLKNEKTKPMFFFHSKSMFKYPHRASITRIFHDTKIDVE